MLWPAPGTELHITRVNTVTVTAFCWWIYRSFIMNSQYLLHDDKSGSRLTAWTSVMPDKNSRSIQIVKGGCCLGTAWQDERRSCKNSTTWSIQGSSSGLLVCRQCYNTDYNYRTICCTTSCALAQIAIGMEHMELHANLCPNYARERNRQNQQ